MGRQVDVYEYLGEADPNVALPVETGDCAACGHRWTAHGVVGCTPAEAPDGRVELSCPCADYAPEPGESAADPPEPESLGFKIGSLFSGACGGLELGLELAGLGSVVWQVEKDEWRRQKLALNWPGVRRYDDVCRVGAKVGRRPDGGETAWALERVDLICGGFPCQDCSGAGKGAGLGGARSGLWWEFDRIVGELRPAWVVVENVASGADRWVDAVRWCLALRGYETLPVPLSASSVGAPHARERVFIVGWLVGGGDGVVQRDDEVVQRLLASLGGVVPDVAWPDGHPGTVGDADGVRGQRQARLDDVGEGRGGLAGAGRAGAAELGDTDAHRREGVGVSGARPEQGGAPGPHADGHGGAGRTYGETNGGRPYVDHEPAECGLIVRGCLDDWDTDEPGSYVGFLDTRCPHCGEFCGSSVTYGYHGPVREVADRAPFGLGAAERYAPAWKRDLAGGGEVGAVGDAGQGAADGVGHLRGGAGDERPEAAGTEPRQPGAASGGRSDAFPHADAHGVRVERERLSGRRSRGVRARGHAEPRRDGAGEGQGRGPELGVGAPVDGTARGLARTAAGEGTATAEGEARVEAEAPRGASHEARNRARFGVVEWPAGRGREQHAWEPPRVIPENSPENRRRLAALGDGVVPQMAEVVGWVVRLLEEGDRAR